MTRRMASRQVGAPGVSSLPNHLSGRRNGPCGSAITRACPAGATSRSIRGRSYGARGAATHNANARPSAPRWPVTTGALTALQAAEW